MAIPLFSDGYIVTPPTPHDSIYEAVHKNCIHGILHKQILKTFEIPPPSTFSVPVMDLKIYRKI